MGKKNTKATEKQPKPETFGEYFEAKILRDLPDFRYKGRKVSLERFKKDENIQAVYMRQNIDTIKAAQRRYRNEDKPTTAADIETIRNVVSYDNSNKFQGVQEISVTETPQNNISPIRESDVLISDLAADKIDIKQVSVMYNGKLTKFSSLGRFKAWFFDPSNGFVDGSDPLVTIEIVMNQNFLTPDYDLLITLVDKEDE